MIETSRRGLITGLISLVAAPAIVKVANIMPVKTVLWTPTYSQHVFIDKLLRMPAAVTMTDEDVEKVMRGEHHRWATVTALEQPPDFWKTMSDIRNSFKVE